MATKTTRKKTGGRNKGTPNRMTSELRELMLGALDDLGGREWVVEPAREKPELMFQMLGRQLPRDVKLGQEGSITLNVITGVPARAELPPIKDAEVFDSGGGRSLPAHHIQAELA